MDEQNKQSNINSTQLSTPENMNINQPGGNSYKKIIFGLLGFFVVVELVWAGWSVFKPVPPPAPSSVVQVKPPKAIIRRASITLSSATTSAKIKETFDLDLGINSNTSTDGLDIILKYNPKFLTVDTSNPSKQPVVVTGIYDEYPVNKVDEKNGLITLSGISTKNDGIIPNGSLGKITFIAKAVGQTEVKVIYDPKVTTDSNVITNGDGQDVLDKPNDLIINISL